MDSHQRRDRPQYSDHQPSPGFKNPQFQEQQQQHSSDLSLLPSELNSSFNKTTSFSRFPTCNAGTGCFSLAQWQELELQALIYKHMLAGVSVPLELVLPIKRSLLGASPYYLYPELYQHLHPHMLQGGFYCGRSGVDPELGRCRRTDGKKWRCSREVVVGQKYCERHVHRGRIRSRKHVEITTPSSINGCRATTISYPEGLNQENHFNRPGLLSTLDILAHNQRQADAEQVGKSLQSNCSNLYNQENFEGNKAEGYVLQRFFDEWPKSQLQEPNTRVNYNYTSNAASPALLSISIPGHHTISDFALKLSTGYPEKARKEIGNGNNDNTQAFTPRNNGRGWIEQWEASMGGPLAEALRSSAPSHPPTSVLQKPNGLVSETSSISP